MEHNVERGGNLIVADRPKCKLSYYEKFFKTYTAGRQNVSEY